jgi:ribosomal protein S18 acetylase RimI-like enzyme
VAALDEGDRSVRVAGGEDILAVARLLHDFNAEYGEPSPPPPELAARIAALLEAGDTFVVVGGSGPDAVAVVRCRPALWSPGRECYLAELYVVPPLRGRGLGRAVLQAAMDEARRRGADRMDLGTSETDVAARRLYEAMGFTNREGGAGGPVMYVYERDL